MNSMDETGKLYNFLNLLSDFKIEIPIIQRDYAQGRKDKSKIRKNFLNALKEAIESEQQINLDFIYGSMSENVMQPLDGQQRLTTLFLLHWYAYTLKGVFANEDAILLNKFTYETRTSSREFCNALIKNTFQITIEEDLDFQIRDKSWYFLSWELDPTISSMIRTLSDIHKMFQKVELLYEKLFHKKTLINFYYIELENFGLSDDLYIKMNARGKALTSFENFKASLEKKVIDKKWEIPTLFEDSFAVKIDTSWTEMLWQHRKDNSVDSAFMRILSTLFMIYLAKNKDSDRQTKILRLNRNYDVLIADDFSIDAFEYTKVALNVYEKYKDQLDNLKLDFTFFQHLENKDIFKTLVFDGGTPSYTQRILFFAQLEYLLETEHFDKEKYNDWMRVIRNIVSRGDTDKFGNRATLIRSPESFDGVVSLIDELAKGCDDILSNLPSMKIKSTFQRDQINEEIQKAIIINSHPKMKDIFLRAESSNLLMGKVEIIFDAMEYKYNINDFDVDLFKKFSDIIIDNFNETINDDIRRALLCIPNNIGEYKYYNYWWSYTSIVSSEKRCLIAKFRELEYYIYGGYKGRKEYSRYFVKLLQILKEKTLKEIVNEFELPENMPNWQYRLIKEELLLKDFCRSKYIAISQSRDKIFLLKGVRPRSLDSCYEVI